ncbi:MAG: molybdopterin oxidoreductase family protein [Conexivisphaera sp.]
MREYPGLGATAICPYCGLACRLRLTPDSTAPDPTDPVSRGSPCVRGMTVHEAIGRGRLLEPMVRRGKRGRAERVGWSDALSRIAREIAGSDPLGVHVAISGKVTNEDALALVRLALSVIGTPNVDGASARVCHSSTVGVLKEILGVPASTGTLDDILGMDLLLLAGTNPAVDYPPMYARIARARARGASVIYLGTLNSETARASDVAVLVRPGGETAVLNYVAREVLESGAPAWVSSVPGWDDYYSWISAYDRRRAEEALIGPTEALSRAVDLVIDSVRMGVASGMGLTHAPGGCAALVSLYDLALLKRATVVTMRGLVNVQGVGDMGACPGLGCWDEEHRRAAESRWGPLPRGGLTFTDALLEGRPDVIIMTDMNPLHSLPEPRAVRRALEDAFVVCMCSYSNETSELADVLLPVPMMPEREGTVTNGERRVRPVARALPPPGSSRQEWEIAVALARLLGSEMGYSSALDVTREIKALVPGYQGIDVEALAAGRDQWADKGPVRPRLAVAEDPGPVRAPPGSWLIVDLRSPHHFLGGEVTWRVRSLARASGGPAIMMNPRDLEELGIAGARVRACSEVGCVEAPVRANPSIPRGFLGYYLSNRRARYNDLVPWRPSPCSRTPLYKYVPVTLYLGEEPLSPPLGPEEVEVFRKGTHPLG